MLTPEERERQAEIAAAYPSGARDTCSMDKYILDDVDGASEGPVRAPISFHYSYRKLASIQSSEISFLVLIRL